MDRASSDDQKSNEPLLSEDLSTHEKDEEWGASAKNRQPWSGNRDSVMKLAASLSLFLNVVLGSLCLWLWFHSSRPVSPLPPWPDSLYSPAQGAVEYETVIFNSDFPEDESGTTEYYGSTPEVNKAWKDLLDPYRVQISGEEAARLATPTSQISKDPDYYITSLDVYHQLHCLNNLRETFAEYGMAGTQLDKLGWMHKFHCIDSLRQSLMCNADLSLIHWHWKERDPNPGRHFPNATTTHICRKWSKIHEWATEHRINETMYDPERLIE